MKRFSSKEISRLARVGKQALNEQPGLALLVEFKVGSGIQPAMFGNNEPKPESNEGAKHGNAME